MCDFKYIVDKNKEHLETTGTTAELADTVARIVNLIYAKTHRANPEAAREFKTGLILALLDPDSPVWDTSKNVTGNVADVAMVFKKPEGRT